MVGTHIGEYRVVRLLGQGGMGAVYEAENRTIGGRVAIKVLHPNHAREQELLRRFFNEARAVNMIEHPGLVKVFHFGQLENGSAYLVMEHLGGESLASRLHRNERLSIGQSKSIAHQIAMALVAAHKLSIIHRDLKPSNVMLVTDPAMPDGERVKVLDFGIAKLPRQTAEGAQPMTRAGSSMGTPEYMAPEQCQEAAYVDEKADVYSLGVMLSQLLAGRLPFDAGSTYGLMYQHINKPAPVLSSLVAGIPTSLDLLVQRMLAKEPGTRPSMAEAAAELGTSGSSTADPVTIEQAPKGTMSTRWLAAVGAALILIPICWALSHALLKTKAARHDSVVPAMLTPATSSAAPHASAVAPVEDKHQPPEARKNSGAAVPEAAVPRSAPAAGRPGSDAPPVNTGSHVSSSTSKPIHVTPHPIAPTNEKAVTAEPPATSHGKVQYDVSQFKD
jgi:serine/threonine protein kinase